VAQKGSQPGHTRGFDEQMAALDALKGRELDAAGIALVRKMLGNRSNFLVGKAARLAEENNLRELMPEMLAAFERFFENAEKNDPQCWAKNALSRALAKLECRDKDVYLRGLTFHQYEPVWGGRSDTAGTLRGNCALALVVCEGLSTHDLLVLLLEPLTDEDKSARVEAVRALAALGDPAVPVLRLRALVPGPEPEEMLAVCYQALLAIEREDAVPFVAQFLEQGDDSAAEAAFALAGTHMPMALDALIQSQKKNPEPWFMGVLLSAIALTRLPEGVDFLIGLIEREAREAEMAIEALAQAAPGEELRARIAKAVEGTGSPRLKKALEEDLPPLRGDG
jgi:HEAT repeat protein